MEAPLKQSVDACGKKQFRALELKRCVASREISDVLLPALLALATARSRPCILEPDRDIRLSLGCAIPAKMQAREPGQHQAGCLPFVSNASVLYRANGNNNDVLCWYLGNVPCTAPFTLYNRDPYRGAPTRACIPKWQVCAPQKPNGYDYTSVMASAY